MTAGVVPCDGDQDVVFANGCEQDSAGSAIQPTLPINESNQGRGLVDEAVSRLPTLSTKGRLVVAFDIEGDGDEDEDLLFPCNGPSQQRLHVNDGAGRFLAVTTALRPPSRARPTKRRPPTSTTTATSTWRSCRSAAAPTP